jgi:ribosomal protein L11 methyltransferase
MVCPSWDIIPPGEGRDMIILDPGQAFGTGLHESTRICVREMEARIQPGTRLLDLGCGSGILSIAGIFLGARFSLGLDNDIVACTTTRSNARLNKVQDKIFQVCTDITRWLPMYRWDLIIANILPNILLRLIDQIKLFRNSGIHVFFSGIPAGEETGIISALEKNGFVKLSIKELSGWLLLRFIA